MALRFYRLLAIGLGVVISTASFAEQFEKENELLEQANQGEARAMYILGDKYCHIGNYQQSLYWQEKYAVAEGAYNPDFQKKQIAEAYQTGHCDPYGEGKHSSPLFPPNYAKAIVWLDKIIYQSKDKTSSDYFSAKFDLAEIYFWGKGGIAKDGTIAKGYYEELANIDNQIIKKEKEQKGFSVIKETRGNARRRLAQMYYRGIFVRQDYAKAFDWAVKSLQDNNSYGAEMVAVLQYEGKGTTLNKAQATDLMGAVCDTAAIQQACDWYQDMRANRPLRDGGL